METLKETVFIFLTSVLLATLIGIPVGGVVCAIRAIEGPLTCAADAEKMGLKEDWGFWTGCMVEVEPDKIIPLDKYRYIDSNGQVKSLE